MKTIRLKIDELFELSGETPPAPDKRDIEVITLTVMKKFEFLPQPTIITIDGDEVVVQFPEESSAAQAEAQRLATMAAKRAAEGDYNKAIGIFKRALQHQPSLQTARRDLAMAYSEIGDVESAIDNLIEVLRVAPDDAWSLVVLANLYIGKKGDVETGRKLLTKALKIEPDDTWALNSLAALELKAGKPEDSITLFERAITANPEYANPYYGEALAFETMKQVDKSLESLARLFARARMQDARSKVVFENARDMFEQIQEGLARRNESDAAKCIQEYRAELEQLSGYPVRIQETDFEDKAGARIQMAWTHGREYHLIDTRRGYSSVLLSHLEAHELTHLKLESEARKIGRNLFFTTTARTREIAIRSVEKDITRWEKMGYSEQAIIQTSLLMVNGLCGFLFNCPVDMLIERYIRTAFPILRPVQYLSTKVMAEEAWQINGDPKVQKLMPRTIVRATLALNGMYGLFLDDLFQGATTFAANYRKTDAFGMSQRLYRHWQLRADNLGPGEEYQLVDELADILKLRDWYEWKVDPGQHEITTKPLRSGTTNPDLLKEKHSAAIFYFLDVLKRFDRLTEDKIREIAFEVALVGLKGLDYAAPEKQYTLRSIPNEEFTGLYLMCLMYAGFQRIAPDQDCGMDLHDPYLAALQLHQSGQDGYGTE